MGGGVAGAGGGSRGSMRVAAQVARVAEARRSTLRALATSTVMRDSLVSRLTAPCDASSARTPGPSIRIRSGSSEQNTGSGGQTHDIGQTTHGFADAAEVDAVCAGTICTVSLLYDQSGKGSHLPVAKAGIPAGGPFAAMDDFESSATEESLTVGGHKVYSLYMEPRQGYRLPQVGDGMPRAFEPQGIYMLADGTHAGVGCCFEFGNSPPTFLFGNTTALFYGRGFDTVGAGNGPWFMMEFGDYLSPGTSAAALPAPPNPNNPSLAVKFALGFLKTDSTSALGPLGAPDG